MLPGLPRHADGHDRAPEVQIHTVAQVARNDSGIASYRSGYGVGQHDKQSRTAPRSVQVAFVPDRRIVGGFCYFLFLFLFLFKKKIFFTKVPYTNHLVSEPQRKYKGRGGRNWVVAMGDVQ